jgi:hypothetical protein
MLNSALSGIIQKSAVKKKFWVVCFKNKVLGLSCFGSFSEISHPV